MTHLTVSEFNKLRGRLEEMQYPNKIVKESSNILSNFLCNSFSSSIKLSIFLEILKHADIIPLYKKGKKDIKGNYNPVSFLQNLSQIFEKCMFKQMSQTFENIFS